MSIVKVMKNEVLICFPNRDCTNRGLYFLIEIAQFILPNRNSINRGFILPKIEMVQIEGSYFPIEIAQLEVSYFPTEIV